MEERKQYDVLTLNPDYRFVRVVSEEGVFYDLIRKWRAREYVYRLRQRYPDARTVGRAFVPPCICRDFTEAEGAAQYREAVWKQGTQAVFPLALSDLQLFETGK